MIITLWNLYSPLVDRQTSTEVIDCPTSWTIRGLSRGSGKRYSFLQKVQASSEAHPASYSIQFSSIQFNSIQGLHVFQ